MCIKFCRFDGSTDYNQPARTLDEETEIAESKGRLVSEEKSAMEIDSRAAFPHLDVENVCINKIIFIVHKRSERNEL